MGNVQRAIDLTPRAWSSPNSSTTTMSTMSAQDSDRLTKNELAVSTFQNMAKLITQRMDNFENSSAHQQTQITDLTRTQQSNFDALSQAIAESNKKTDSLQQLAEANNKTHDQLLQAMTALLQQNQRHLVNNGLN
jgi:septal ring factor EnvC (AmiA/AmiB activator)